MRGAFITVEGIDGAGKGTHLGFIAQYLEARGVRVVRTREPGGTAVGEALRRIILAHDAPISDRAELLMIFAARAQHLDEVIAPALADGACVLCDRFTDSTYAYQGGGRGIADDAIAALEDWVQDDLQPDLTVLLDAPVEIGGARTDYRATAPRNDSLAMQDADCAPDRFEREAGAFHQAVRDAYLARAEKFERIKTINADQSIEAVREELTDVLESFWRARQAAQ